MLRVQLNDSTGMLKYNIIDTLLFGLIFLVTKPMTLYDIIDSFVIGTRMFTQSNYNRLTM